MPLRPWSTGCYTCRKRKVKCDEGKPSCKKCIQMGKTCPGYRDNSELVFRSMNKSVAAKVPTSSEARQPTKQNRIVLLQAQPSINWEQNSIAHFMHHFVSRPTDWTNGYLEFLPELVSKNQQTHYLSFALLAVGMASLANISMMPQLELESQRAYGQALREVSKALNRSGPRNTDALLTSIVLLQNYEVISDTSKVPRDPHDAGLAKLLEHGLQEKSDVILQLARLIHSRQQLNNLDAHLPPLPMPPLKVFGPLPLRQELWRLLQEASKCCWALKNLMTRDFESSGSALELQASVKQALSINTQLSSWIDSVPEHWLYQSVTMPASNTQKLGYPIKVHLFKNIHHGGMWLGYWSSRIRLLQQLVPAYTFLLSQSPRQNFHIEPNELDTSLLVDEICSSAPFMMGDVDERGQLRTNSDRKMLGPYFLLRALHVTNSVEDLYPAQREWGMDCFLRIRYVGGIKMALRARNLWLKKAALMESNNVQELQKDSRAPAQTMFCLLEN